MTASLSRRVRKTGCVGWQTSIYFSKNPKGRSHLSKIFHTRELAMAFIAEYEKEITLDPSKKNYDFAKELRKKYEDKS